MKHNTYRRNGTQIRVTYELCRARCPTYEYCGGYGIQMLYTFPDGLGNPTPTGLTVPSPLFLSSASLLLRVLALNYSDVSHFTLAHVAPLGLNESIPFTNNVLCFTLHLFRILAHNSMMDKRKEIVSLTVQPDYAILHYQHYIKPIS